MWRPIQWQKDTDGMREEDIKGSRPAYDNIY